MAELVVNEPTMSCCGLPREECACGDGDQLMQNVRTGEIRRRSEIPPEELGGAPDDGDMLTIPVLNFDDNEGDAALDDDADMLLLPDVRNSRRAVCSKTKTTAAVAKAKAASIRTSARPKKARRQFVANDDGDVLFLPSMDWSDWSDGGNVDDDVLAPPMMDL